MTRFAERFRREGLEKGMQQGETLILLRQLQLKFGELSEETRRHIAQADEEMLLQWSERVLSATSLDEVLH